VFGGQFPQCLIQKLEIDKEIFADQEGGEAGS
jgi:hypothetical protein